MISFTYCVSRYNDKTALSVFVSLHISHPAPRRSLIRDKAFVKRPRRFIPEHDARRGGGGVPRGIVYEEIDEYIDDLANRGDPARRAVEQQGEKEGWPIGAAAEGRLLHIRARSNRAPRNPR